MQIALLLVCLLSRPCKRWISANVGFAAFVFEVDLRLILSVSENRSAAPPFHTLLPVGGQILSQSSRRALPQVIQFIASSGRNSALAARSRERVHHTGTQL